MKTFSDDFISNLNPFSEFSALIFFKGTVRQTEKARIYDCLRVSKVS